MKKVALFILCLFPFLLRTGKSMNGRLPVASTNQLKQLNNSMTTAVIVQWNKKK